MHPWQQVEMYLDICSVVNILTLFTMYVLHIFISNCQSSTGAFSVQLEASGYEICAAYNTRPIYSYDCWYINPNVVNKTIFSSYWCQTYAPGLWYFYLYNRYNYTSNYTISAITDDGIFTNKQFFWEFSLAPIKQMQPDTNVTFTMDAYSQMRIYTINAPGNSTLLVTWSITAYSL